MTGTLWHVAAAALAFVGIHFLTGAEIRTRIVAAIGEGRWLGLFSAVSGLLLAWLIWAYGDAPYVALWPQAAWTRWLPLLVMPFAWVLLACSLLTPNPTAVGQRLARSGEPARGIIKVTRHPLMWAFALWALAHIPANGDAASLILMGSIAVLALGGMRAMDAKLRARKGADWDRLARVTSAIPFRAVIEGRARVTLAEIGWRRIGVGLALYVLFLFAHGWAIGVPAWPVP